MSRKTENLQIRSKISSDWYGDSGAENCEFSIEEKSKNRFIYSCKLNFEMQKNPGEKMGDFIENLWQRDVVELFIKEYNSSRYLEFNFSPSGAWWAKRFLSYRKSDDSVSLKDLKLKPKIAASNDSSFEMSVEISGLEQYLESFDKINFSVIKYLPNKKEIYFSNNADSDKEPDFHSDEKYLQIDPVALGDC